MEGCSIHTNFIEDGFEEIEMNFRLEYSARKNRATLPDVPLLPEISAGTNQKVNNQFLAVAVYKRMYENR